MKIEKIENGISSLFIILVIAYFYRTVFLWTPNIPNMDDYALVLDFLNRFMKSRLDWNLFFAQQNEHRPVFIRIVSWLDWFLGKKVDFTMLTFIGDLGYLGLFFLFAKSIVWPEAGKASGPESKFPFPSAFALVPLALIFFAYDYWEDIYWVSAVYTTLWVILFGLLAMYFLAKDKSFQTALFSVAATFSLGGGMAAFPIAILIFGLRGKRVSLGVLSLAFLGTELLYFRGYVEPTFHPSALSAIFHPLEMAAFTFAFLGNDAILPFDGRIPPSLMISLSLVVGVVLFVYFLFLTARSYYRTNPIIYYFMCFMISDGIMAALTRFSYGLPYVLTSRYAVNSAVLLACVYVSLLDLGILKDKKALTLTVVLLALMDGMSFQVAEPQQNLRIRSLLVPVMLYVQNRSLGENKDEELEFGYPKNKADILGTAKQAGIYDLGEAVKNERMGDYFSMPQSFSMGDTHEGGGFFTLSSLKAGKDFLEVQGWSFMTPQDGPSVEKYVVLRSKQETYVFNSFPEKRHDVSQHYHGDLDLSGFYALILNGSVKRGDYELWIFLRGNGKSLCQDTHTKIFMSGPS